MEQLVGKPSLLRDINYRSVFEHVAARGPISRTEISDELNLSPASVSRLIDDLLKAKLILEGERVAAGMGRRRTLLDINPQAALVAGLSIRSQTVRLVLADLQGTVLKQDKFTLKTTKPKKLVSRIKKRLLAARDEVAAKVPLGSVIVGVQGAWNPTSQHVYAAPHLSFLEDVNLLAQFENALKTYVFSQSVSVDNDINFAALGEGSYGAAQEVDSFFYLHLGSGVGGAAVTHGSLRRGVDGFAGELGYVPIYMDGKALPLEQVVSKAALEGYARDLKLGSLEALFAQMEKGSKKTQAIMERTSEALALAVAAVVTTLNPEMIVLGGSVGRYSNVWIPAIEQKLSNFPIPTRIVSTRLGPNASLRGSVAYGLKVARQALLREEVL